MKKYILLLLTLIISSSFLVSCFEVEPNETRSYTIEEENQMEIRELITDFVKATKSREPLTPFYTGEIWKVDEVGGTVDSMFGKEIADFYYESISVEMGDVIFISETEAEVAILFRYADVLKSFELFARDSDVRGEVQNTEEYFEAFNDFLIDPQNSGLTTKEQSLRFVCVKGADESWKIDFDQTFNKVI